MNKANDSVLILLWHDGELDDLRPLLEELGAQVIERRGSLTSTDAQRSWRAIIATPKRLLRVKLPPRGQRPAIVAMTNQSSKTLKSQMMRLRVDLFVQRPVHPAALRLLILHTLYNGPERRGKDRISIGAPVRLRFGLFARPAMLAEISDRGARLLLDHPVDKDTKVRIMIGRELTKSGALKIPARVVRVVEREGCEIELGVRFEKLNAGRTLEVSRFIDLHRGGPVQIRPHWADDDSMSGATPVPPNPMRQTTAETSVPFDAATTRPRTKIAAPAPEAPREAVASASSARRPTEALAAASPTPVATTAAPKKTAPAPAKADPREPGDRRGGGRRDYEKRVVSLDEEAARVLLGRDISPGGMRVDANTELSVGCTLKLALHAGGRSEPVVVEARVDRDDGDDGLFLKFNELGETGRRELGRMIEQLPLSTSDESGAEIIISQVLEVHGGASQLS